MKAIIGNKLYDTDKAERVIKYSKRVNKGPFLFNPKWTYCPAHNFGLYRTKKGAFFEHDEEDNTIQAITETQGKEIVRTLDPDKYMELFDEVVKEA